MTIPSIVRIALVSHFSEVGDWALQAALRVAQCRPAALNVYYFLESPYEVPLSKAPVELLPPDADNATLVRKEREVREYFEERLGDFDKVRFRVCETGRHNQELRRCLLHREYQLLIIPCPRRGVSFGNMPIEEFAYVAMTAPPPTPGRRSKPRTPPRAKQRARPLWARRAQRIPTTARHR